MATATSREQIKSGIPVRQDTSLGYLIVDTESIPDGQLLAQVKYPGQDLSPERAIELAQEEARSLSPTGSDFLPVTMQIPVAVCVARVSVDLSLEAVTCLDAPRFDSRRITELFWSGMSRYKKRKLVTFNGRGFDMPLLELAAFRYGFSAQEFIRSRDRYRGSHLDLMDFMTNMGAFRINGGLNLLAKLIGKPGKMDVSGDQVYRLHQEGRLRDINEYCLCDTLDTYFVFLRTRVVTGDLDIDEEEKLVHSAHEWLEGKIDEWPILRKYLDGWKGMAIASGTANLDRGGSVF